MSSELLVIINEIKDCYNKDPRRKIAKAKLDLLNSLLPSSEFFSYIKNNELKIGSALLGLIRDNKIAFTDLAKRTISSNNQYLIQNLIKGANKKFEITPVSVVNQKSTISSSSFVPNFISGNFNYKNKEFQLDYPSHDLNNDNFWQGSLLSILGEQELVTEIDFKLEKNAKDKFREFKLNKRKQIMELTLKIKLSPVTLPYKIPLLNLIERMKTHLKLDLKELDKVDLISATSFEVRNFFKNFQNISIHKLLHEFQRLETELAIITYQANPTNKNFDLIIQQLEKRMNILDDKGWMGAFIEELFGIKRNSKSEKDANNYELKTAHIHLNSQCEIKFKEDLVITMINKNKVAGVAFKDSSLLHKLENILFLAFFNDNNETCIGDAYVLDLHNRPELFDIIEKEYKIIQAKLDNNEDLSMSHTDILVAKTKGAKNSTSRAFSLRSKYLPYVFGVVNSLPKKED